MWIVSLVPSTISFRLQGIASPVYTASSVVFSLFFHRFVLYGQHWGVSGLYDGLHGCLQRIAKEKTARSAMGSAASRRCDTGCPDVRTCILCTNILHFFISSCGIPWGFLAISILCRFLHPSYNYCHLSCAPHTE